MHEIPVLTWEDWLRIGLLTVQTLKFRAEILTNSDALVVYLLAKIAPISLLKIPIAGPK